MLNWRRDPDYEQRKMQSEWRMKRIDERTKQIENEILLVRKDRERIEKDTEQIENEILLVRKDRERIKKDTERLRLENARLRQLNAKTRHLISCVDRLCFPPESSSIPQTPTEPDCEPSSP